MRNGGADISLFSVRFSIYSQFILMPLSRFLLLRRHAIFPVFVYIVLSMILKENYPFSHFPMYSNPSTKPLSYFYLADGEGDPVRLLYHTGLTPSRLTKRLGNEKTKYEKKGGLSEEEIVAKAGIDVLTFIRKLNAKRIKSRPLPEKIQLVQMRISLDGSDEGFSEERIYVAENEIQKKEAK